ncbi:MAG: FixH family protein [Pseudomonadota bacterium]
MACALCACQRSSDAPSVWSSQTASGRYAVAFSPREGAPRIGEYQQWIIALHDASGRAVHPAQLAIDGGMLDHGHGLPTRPQVTRYLDGGRYLVEGVRFNMAGEWTMQIAVDGPDGRDDAQLSVVLEL